MLMRLREYAFPVIGTLPVGAIDKALILKALAPIWQQKHATAIRTLVEPRDVGIQYLRTSFFVMTKIAI
jgi:Phage integrase central domain